jgi:hypothetical protein
LAGATGVEGVHRYLQYRLVVAGAPYRSIKPSSGGTT